MSLISLEQYGTRVGIAYDESSPGDTEEQLLALLDDASALVNLIAFGRTTASYWDDVDDSSPANPLPAALVPVIVKMVRRAKDNPRGLSGEQLGDYQWQVAGGSQTIFATAEERRIIRRAAGSLSVATVALEGDLPLTTLSGSWEEDDLTEDIP